jgi:membrane associated rhomboid family serine protease
LRLSWSPADHRSDDRMTDLVEVARFGARAEAEQRALVLAAVGIEVHLLRDAGALRLCVPAEDALRADYELACYERENAAPKRPRFPARAALRRSEGALVYIAVLLFFFGAERRDAFSIDWVAAGAANAGLIWAGEWWRTVTALSLHADLGHLMGNLASGVVVGLLVAELLGSGLGWLAILMTGAVGNGLDALVHAADHTAIGASTAVFGGLGILSGHSRRSQIIPWRGGLRRWAPIGAGIMLLAFLGFGGERTAVWAHVAGFGVGVALGLALAHVGDRLPQGAQAQRIYGVVAVGLFALAWLLGLLALE